MQEGASPGENKDDLARAREVARRLDSKWFAYLPVDVCTPEVIKKYPDWAWLDADGKIKQWAPHANSRMICMRRTANGKATCTSSTCPSSRRSSPSTTPTVSGLTETSASRSCSAGAPTA